MSCLVGMSCLLAPFPASCLNANSLSLLKPHARNPSSTAAYPTMSDVTKYGGTKSTKNYRMMHSVILASLAWIFISSEPKITIAQESNTVDGELIFQSRCYQCHAGLDLNLSWLPHFEDIILSDLFSLFFSKEQIPIEIIFPFYRRRQQYQAKSTTDNRCPRKKQYLLT